MNAKLSTTLLMFSIVACGFGSHAAGQDTIRLRDFIDNPDTILQWNKSIADGWRMQQNICNRRIEHHKTLYGEQVMNAVPTQPIVPPKKPRKLLVLQMFFHDDTSGMQGTFLEALEEMAKQTKAFEVTVAQTLTELTREELFAFDSVLVSGTNYSLLRPSLDPDQVFRGRQIGRIKPSIRYHFMFEKTPEQRAHGNAMRQALLEYVSQGGGLIGIGGAPRSDWPEYRRMFGCVDNGDYGTVIGQKEPKELLTDRLEVRADASNNLTQMMPSDTAISVHSGVLLADPAFHKASNNTTLLSVDVNQSNEDFCARMKRIDKWPDQLPASWIRSHGKGRVFYCVFDCTGRFMMSKPIQKHVLAGIQYSLGDLEQ